MFTIPMVEDRTFSESLTHIFRLVRGCETTSKLGHACGSLVCDLSAASFLNSHEATLCLPYANTGPGLPGASTPTDCVLS